MQEKSEEQALEQGIELKVHNVDSEIQPEEFEDDGNESLAIIDKGFRKIFQTHPEFKGL